MAKLHLDLNKLDGRELEHSLDKAARYMEEAVLLGQGLRRCASCGSTHNLISGWAGGNEIVYCPVCKRDEERR